MKGLINGIKCECNRPSITMHSNIVGDFSWNDFKFSGDVKESDKYIVELVSGLEVWEITGKLSNGVIKVNKALLRG